MAIWTERPFARILIPGMVKEGMPITKIVKELKSLGFGYRTQTMFRDVHAFKGFLDKEYLFKDYDRSLAPGSDMMTETVLKRAKGYRAYGEANIYNMRTEQYEQRMVSMYYDEEKSLEELEDAFLRDKEETKYLPDEIVEGITFMGLEHNEGFPY